MIRTPIEYFINANYVLIYQQIASLNLIDFLHEDLVLPKILVSISHIKLIRITFYIYVSVFYLFFLNL